MSVSSVSRVKDWPLPDWSVPNSVVTLIHVSYRALMCFRNKPSMCRSRDRPFGNRTEYMKNRIYLENINRNNLITVIKFYCLDSIK